MDLAGTGNFRRAGIAWTTSRCGNFRGHDLRVFQEVRALEIAAGCNATDHVRELKGGCGDGTLTNGNGNCFAGIPLTMIDALNPLLGRNQAGFFGWQIDAGFRTESQHFRVFRDAIDSQALAYVVKENVTGMNDGFVQIHDTVAAFAENVALEHAAVEVCVSWAKRGKAFRRCFLL